MSHLPGSPWFRFRLDRGRGPGVWSVREAGEDDSPQMVSALGLCDRRHRVILVDPSHDSADEIGSTVLHEMLHAAWPLNRVHDNEHEEHVVGALERRLWPVLVAHGLRWPERKRR